jgi:hypothetical protein
MFAWMKRRTISQELELQLQDALMNFHIAAAAKEEWKSRKAMLRERIIRLRNQIILAKAEETWKSTSEGGSSPRTVGPDGKSECPLPSSAPIAVTFGEGSLVGLHGTRSSSAARDTRPPTQWEDRSSRTTSGPEELTRS